MGHLILNMKTTMWQENTPNYLHEAHTWQFEMISIGKPGAWVGITLNNNLAAVLPVLPGSPTLNFLFGEIIKTPPRLLCNL